MMESLEHSPLGGSSAYRFMECAASFLLHRAQIENEEFTPTETEWSKLGVAAHEVAAAALKKGVEPFEFVGQSVDGFMVGAEVGISLDAVHIYFNECMSIIDKHSTGQVIVEESYNPKELHPLLKGTIDFAFIGTDTIYLRDYKNGAGVAVSSINNSQLLYYAFLLAVSDERIQKMPPYTLVDLAIVQPNYYGVFDKPQNWVVTLAYVRDWGYGTLLPRMEQLTKQQDIDANDYVSGNHCQFCPVLLDCQKLQQSFTNFAKAANEDFIDMLTNEELSDFYAQREDVRRFMNGIDGAVYARMIGGAEITSAKLVEKKVNRAWRPGAEEALIEFFGDDAYEPKKIRSPAQIEKLSSIGKEMSVEWGYKPSADALTVAPVSDPRPEAKPRASEQVFSQFKNFDF